MYRPTVIGALLLAGAFAEVRKPSVVLTRLRRGKYFGRGEAKRYDRDQRKEYLDESPIKPAHKTPQDKVTALHRSTRDRSG